MSGWKSALTFWRTDGAENDDEDGEDEVCDPDVYYVGTTYRSAEVTRHKERVVYTNGESEIVEWDRFTEGTWRQKHTGRSDDDGVRRYARVTSAEWNQGDYYPNVDFETVMTVPHSSVQKFEPVGEPENVVVNEYTDEQVFVRKASELDPEQIEDIVQIGDVVVDEERLEKFEDE